MSTVDRLYAAHVELLHYLDKQEQISLRTAQEEIFPKVLAVSAASYFEDMVTTCIVAFANEMSQTTLLTSFLKRKAVDRQFHTYFNWDVKNANQFFKLFGIEFDEFMESELENDSTLAAGVRAFMELGSFWNSIVHEASHHTFLKRLRTTYTYSFNRLRSS